MKQLISKHKLSRLQLLAKRWNKQTNTSQKLSQKITRLASELQGVFTLSTLRKTLGAAAILLGTTFSQQATAQDDISFGNVDVNPFGLISVGEVGIPTFVDLDNDGDLDLIVKMLRLYPEMEIELGSHTDSRGSDDYNRSLARWRGVVVLILCNTLACISIYVLHQRWFPMKHSLFVCC